MRKIWLFFKANWLIILLTLIGLFLRLYRLSNPQEIVFDETYYAVFAQKYLVGQPFFDVHPPLGKLLIALGQMLFGNNSLGWRILPAIFGTLIIPLSYLLTKKLFQSKSIALVTALLVILDGMFLVQSRTGLLAIFLTFFIILSYWLILEYWQNKKKVFLILTGFALGLGMSVQWLMLPFWLILWFLTIVFSLKSFYFQNKQLKSYYFPWKFLKELLFINLSLIIIPVLVYLLFFLFDSHQKDYQNYWQYLLWWHQQTWGFHQNLQAAHPYQSRWWSWLYLVRPVWYYFKNEGGKVMGVLALGNPLIWWTAMASLIYSLYDLIKNKKTRLLLPIIIFLLYWLSWIVIKRTQFQYYILNGLVFYFMILAYYWQKIYQKYQKLALIWLILAISLFIFYYPLYTAWPIAEWFYKLHIWFRSWI